MQSKNKNHFPLHRPEIETSLERGDAAIDALMDGNRLHFSPRETIAGQGDPLGHVFRLIDGWCARVRTLPDARVQIIAVYMPGELMALKSMFLVEQADAIQALSHVEVAAVPQDRLRDAMRGEPDIAVRVGFALIEEERRMHNRVVRLGQGDAAERVGAMLIVMRNRLLKIGKLDPKACAYRLPMTQVQISEFLGLTPVHVNRVFRRLREDGLATIAAGEVRFQNYDGLARLAAPVLDNYERETV